MENKLTGFKLYESLQKTHGYENTFKCAEEYAEDLALKFAEWLSKNNWGSDNGINYMVMTETGILVKSAKELLQIFKQEQQKTGNNG